MLRLYGFLPATWNQRFARHFHAVIEAYDREFRNRTEGTYPASTSTSPCAVSPSPTGYGRTCWNPVPDVNCRTMYGKTRPTAGRRCSSQEFAAWYSDLCSLPKEIAGDEVHNLGISLITHGG